MSTSSEINTWLGQEINEGILISGPDTLRNQAKSAASRIISGTSSVALATAENVGQAILKITSDLNERKK